MKYIIFCCSPRTKVKSNTALIAEAFGKGFSGEAEVEIQYIYQREKWKLYRGALKKHLS